MKISIKILSAILSVALFGIFINGCKKTDKISSEDKNLENFKKRIKEEPFSYTRILNLPGKGFYADEDGNQIFPSRNNSGRTSSVCPDPWDDYPTQSIYSVKTEFTCGQGYRVEVKYDLTLVYVPQYTNGSGLPSFGRLRLKNSGGTVTWPTGTPPKYNVTSIANVGSAGNDPNGNPQTIWRITFKTDYIPEATFNAAATLETYLFVYTDCPNIPTVVIPYSPQQSSSTSAHNAYPCLRTDKVYWNPGHTGWPSDISGCNPVGSGCFPFGYVFPDKQEIQFFYSGAWGYIDFIFPAVNPSTRITNGRINYFDLYYVDLASHSLSPGIYPSRYRNKQTGTSNGGPCDGDWVYESNWYLY